LKLAPKEALQTSRQELLFNQWREVLHKASSTRSLPPGKHRYRLTNPRGDDLHHEDNSLSRTRNHSKPACLNGAHRFGMVSNRFW